MVSGPAQYGATAPTLRCTKGDGKPAVSRRMPGAGLSLWRSGKAPPNKPAFQPYWGKPAVRNERGDRGNVGIIRSPVRASILPDCGGRSVMGVPTAIKATYRLLEQGVLPGQKVGGRWTVSRAGLRCFFDPALSGEDVRQGGR